MRVERDYEEFFGLLNKYEVKYCVIGAYAVAFHAIPRYTKDIDVLIEPSLQNAEKIVAALNDFGFESLNLSTRDFSVKGKIIEIGN